MTLRREKQGKMTGSSQADAQEGRVKTKKKTEGGYENIAKETESTRTERRVWESQVRFGGGEGYTLLWLKKKKKNKKYAKKRNKKNF